MSLALPSAHQHSFVFEQSFLWCDILIIAVDPVIKRELASLLRLKPVHIWRTCNFSVSWSALRRYRNLFSATSRLAQGRFPETQCQSCIIYLYYYALQLLKAYCAIWVRHSNFRHQASPRVSPRESTQRRKVELWAGNIRQILPKCWFTRYIYGSFTCRKAMIWDRRLYFPSEGRHAEDFFSP